MQSPYRRCIKKEGILDKGILDELAKTIRRQHCALLIGLGLALPAVIDEKLPPRDLKDLLRGMIQWCVEHKVITQREVEDDFKKTLEKETIEADELEKMELTIQKEYFTDADQRRQCMIEVLLQNPDDVRYIYRLLARMSFRAYFTTGYDQFLEKAYEDIEKSPSLSKYDKASIEDALAANNTEGPFILKLHGDAAKDNKEVITLSSHFAKNQLPKPTFYRQQLRELLTGVYTPEPKIYPQQLRELLADVHTLFVGFEKVDPDLEGLKSAVNKKDELKRWLLIPEKHIDEPEAEKLWSNDKIITLCYADQAELVLFLRKLEEVAATPQQIEVYVSYAPEDNEMRNRLQKHLSVMNYPGLKITWSDGKIEPGLEGKQVIEERLKKAEVILLLVSVDYLASIEESNIKTEVKWAVKRHHKKEARVIPIIFRSCEWKDHAFGRLAALPSDETPVDLASNTDRVLLDIARKVKAAINEWVESH